jgi:hypothetical protein
VSSERVSGRRMSGRLGLRVKLRGYLSIWRRDWVRSSYGRYSISNESCASGGFFAVLDMSSEFD